MTEILFFPMVGGLSSLVMIRGQIMQTPIGQTRKLGFCPKIDGINVLKF